MDKGGKAMAGKALKLNHLSYKTILRDINFTWLQGETVALMGANGSGKSTLARLIAGLIEPSLGDIQLFAGEVPIRWDPEARWREVGFVGQHPRRQVIGATVAEELSFGLFNLGLSTEQVKAQVQELLMSLGLAGKENQSPATLSGGERQRLVTAAVLAMQPSFVILDEALTMLDAQAEERVLVLLDKMKRTIGQLWITHDPELAHRADRVLLLKDGSLRDGGRPKDVLDDGKLRREYGIRPSCGTDFISGFSSADCSPGFPDPKSAPRFSPNFFSRDTSPDFSDADTRFALPGHEEADESDSSPLGGHKLLSWEKAVFDGRLRLDLSVKEKEFVGILGPSGAGKSTLLESAIFLLKSSEGVCFAHGEPIEKCNLEALRRKNRLLLQEAGEYLLGNTVSEEIFYAEDAKKGRGLGKKLLRMLIHREKRGNDSQPGDDKLCYLSRFGISPNLAEKPPEELSGGERQKVALAAALRTGPEVLLLDEPALGLDAFGRQALTAVISELCSKTTILYAAHDLSEVLPFATRLWLVQDGEVALDCAVEDWPNHLQAFRGAGVRCPEGRG